MPQPPLVLLLSFSQDFYGIDLVAQSLAERGARPLRFDTDGFPQAAQLSLVLSSSHARHELFLPDGTHFCAEEVVGVWLRHLGQPQFEEDLDPTFLPTCLRESKATLLGLLSSLPARRWVSPFWAVEQAEDKPHQLRLARACGLSIPRTLISNHPDQVRAFCQALSGGCVAKLLTPISQGMTGDGPFLYTRAITAEDLEDLEGLRYAPMVFQERVPKAWELRAIYVDGHFLVGALDARRYDHLTVDWRVCDGNEVHWEPYTLPHTVCAQLTAFMQALNLRYGAIDLIVTPAGEHVFLEVNPCGEWGMLQRDLDLPIAQTLAEALLRGETP